MEHLRRQRLPSPNEYPPSSASQPVNQSTSRLRSGVLTQHHGLRGGGSTRGEGATGVKATAGQHRLFRPTAVTTGPRRLQAKLHCSGRRKGSQTLPTCTCTCISFSSLFSPVAVPVAVVGPLDWNSTLQLQKKK